MKADVFEIIRAMDTLHESGTVVELRILDCETTKYRRAHQESGFYNDFQKLARDAASIEKAQGFYFTLNPPNPALLARAANRLREARKNGSTSDSDIQRLRWLLIDCDPKRPAGISSTDAEHGASMKLAGLVCKTLLNEGWPEPVTANSGNGAHLLFRIDLPSADCELTARVLRSLAFRFNREIDGVCVEIDESVFNPARICKLYGTVSGKGDSTPERPHRLSKIISVPDEIQIVSREKLEAVAAMLPKEPDEKPSYNGAHRSGFDLAGWILKHGLQVDGPEEWNGGKKWIFPVCPWNREHDDRAAFIAQFSNGAIAAGCQHNGCRGKDWQALRDLFEPDRKQQKQDAPKSARRDDSETSAAPHQDWQAPVPFSEYTLPDFPLNALPRWLADMVEAEAEATQTPVDLPGCLALAMLATTLQKKFVAQIKPGWVEPLNLWVSVAMDPAHRKSAVFGHMIAPLEDYERRETKLLEPQIEEIKLRREIIEKRIDALKKAAAKEAGPTGRAKIQSEILELTTELTALFLPRLPRMITADCTPEKLSNLLCMHSGRMATLDPEGGLFELMAGRYSESGPNLEVYLKSHAGDTLRVDRMGRPSEFVPNPALTIAITPQLMVIAGLSMKPGFRGRGLLGRFLYSIPRSRLGYRSVDPAPMPEFVKARYHNILSALAGIPQDWNPETQEYVSHQMIFDPDAWETMREFMTQIELRLREGGDLAMMTDWGGKLAGAAARIAALLHIAKEVGGIANIANTSKPIQISERVLRITQEALISSIHLSVYFLEHAKAAFALMGADPAVSDAKKLLRWIQRNCNGRFTRRDLFEGVKGTFKSVDGVEPGLELLQKHGYIREVDRQLGKAGRPTQKYDINPRSNNSQYSQNPGEEAA